MIGYELLYVVNDVRPSQHHFEVGSTILRIGYTTTYLGINKDTGLMCYQWLVEDQIIFIGEL